MPFGRGRLLVGVMTIRQHDDAAHEEKERQHADDEPGEGGTSVGAVGHAVLRMNVGVGHAGDGWRASSGDADLGDDVVSLNLLYDIEAVRHFSEYGMHAVQMPAARVAEDDEELAASRVLPRVRHGQRPDLVRTRIARGFTLDFVARAAGANARIAGRKVA